MSMREQIARALFAKEWPRSDPDRVSFGQPAWTTKLPAADAALSALLQLPEKACLPLGEWGVGEEGKRAATLLTWNGFISVIRLIQKGTA